MAKNVLINGVTYSNVPYVSIPLSSGSGNAKFVDTDSGDAVAGDIRSGKKAWVGGDEVTGTKPVKSATDVTVSGGERQRAGRNLRHCCLQDSAYRDKGSHTHHGGAGHHTVHGQVAEKGNGQGGGRDGYGNGGHRPRGRDLLRQQPDQENRHGHLPQGGAGRCHKDADNLIKEDKHGTERNDRRSVLPGCSPH